MKHLTAVLLVAVVTAGSAIGATGPAAAPHRAGTPLAPGRIPDGLVAALWRVLEGERLARYDLPRPGPRDVAVTPAQGFHIAFSRPGLRLAPIGTAASAVSINPWAQQARLTSGDAAGGDTAGLSVAVSGDTAVIGAPGKNGSTGAAYVYVYSGTRWSQQARLTASDGVAGDQFGFSVALSGDTAVVGAPFKNAQTGAAYVFVRRGTGWHQQARLIAGADAGGDWFGASVALSGSTAVVGAPQKNSNAGTAYVFVRSRSGWRQQAVLAAGDAAAGDDFGFSVALSGDSALVGAPQKRSSSRAAYVFVRSGTRWRQQARLAAGDVAANDELGTSVALSGSTAVVGAPGQNSASGAAYVFVRRGTAWRQQARLTASDAAADDNVGLSVALSGKHHGARGAGQERRYRCRVRVCAPWDGLAPASQAGCWRRRG